MESIENNIITTEYDREDIEKNKGMAVLSYFSLLVLIPVFRVRKISKFASFHINQGLVLTIFSTMYGFLSYIVVYAVSQSNVRTGILLEVILSLCGAVFIILLVIGVVNAASGKAKELPTFGKIKILK